MIYKLIELNNALNLIYLVILTLLIELINLFGLIVFVNLISRRWREMEAAAKVAAAKGAAETAVQVIGGGARTRRQ